jgi:hypothetical protein
VRPGSEPEVELVVPLAPSARQLFSMLQIAIGEANRLAEQLATFGLAPHFYVLAHKDDRGEYSTVGFAGAED